MPSAVVSALPKFIALKSNFNQKYLRYVNENVETHGFLQFSGDEALSPFSKIEVVPAAKTGLVHIRCCYNNKYWAARSSKNHWWIVAGANEPEEDQSQSSCTLFEPVVVKGDNPNTTTVRFRHVQLGHYAVLSKSEAVPAYHLCMLAGRATASRTLLDKEDVYTILDLEAELTFPKYVAFKGDNGHYLGLVTNLDADRNPYLQFSPTVSTDISVITEISKTSDGRAFHIKNVQKGLFWRSSGSSPISWIWADATDIGLSNPETMFSAVKVDDNSVLAFQNLGNQAYCKRTTEKNNGILNCLSAVAENTNDVKAHLVVEEIGVSRTIENVIFHYSDARIYNQTENVEVYSKLAINESYEPKTMAINLVYNLPYTSSWDRSEPPFGSDNTKISITSYVPIIADGDEFEFANQFMGEYHWKEPENGKIPVQKIVSVSVAARTICTLTVRATHAACDIPFSYSQEDTPTIGEPTSVITEKEDGIYTCTNFFGIKETKEFKPIE